MSALRKISTVQFLLLAVLVLTVALEVTLKFAARAQDAVPPAWNDADIGTSPAAGSSQRDGASCIVTTSALDVWGQTDFFHFVYQALGTNGQIVARVTGIQGVADGFAKAGVMIRESLDAHARNAMMLLTSSNGTYFQWRLSPGKDSGQTAGNTNESAPCWLKIVRGGDWIGGFASSDGTNWTEVGWQSFPGLAPQVYVGLAAASHNRQGVSCTAGYDQISVGPADFSQIVLPFVGSGDGLMASYYDNRHLYGTPVTNRIERNVDINFVDALGGVQNTSTAYVARCMAFMGMPRMREFGVSWVGEIQAQFSEPYTFHAVSDDGVRIWLNEQLIMDDWTCQSPTKVASATVTLTAGQRYLLRVEYFQNHSVAQIHLRWSSPSTSERVIPQSQLYSRPLDADGNGLPDLWEQHYFGQTGVDPNGDFDGDGVSNLREYQKGLNPANPQSWGVPDSWGHGDIGDGFTQGSADYTNGVFNIVSSGGDIWNLADSFHFVYQPLGATGQIVARVVGMQSQEVLAKAGIMIRETLEDRARNAMVMTRSNAMALQWRQMPGGVSEQGKFYPENQTSWVKLVRNGDWIGGYYSPDGVTWALLDWVVLKNLAPQVYAGLALSAHDGSKNVGSAAAAQFDNVSVGPADPAEMMTVPEGDGDGLLGSYRNDSLLYLPGAITQVNAEVDFNWNHETALNNTMNPDSYGVCWSGEIEPQFSEPYTFSLETRREDWVRVWINEQLIIDGWRTYHPDGRLRGNISLTAGQHYLIRIEVFNNLGHAKAILRWASPSLSERIIAQSQLYSMPQMDPTGSGLPVIWEQIYFGRTGVDPNADPDGDGLSNLQEYHNHTNPVKADTDSDGLPDAWEISRGLDPQYPDANLDYDNSGLSNLQDYLLGLNPYNSDLNQNGLPDSFEEEYLGVGTNLVCSNQISVAAAVNGAQAVNLLGLWQVDGTDIYCLDRRGGVDFNVTLAVADKYVLNLVGTQNQPNPWQSNLKLLLGVDGQSLGHYMLTAGYGTNGTVEVVLPYLTSGSHTFHVFWDGMENFSSLRLKQLKLLSVSGATNQNGVKLWAAGMMAQESGMDNTNGLISSYSSPACVEGRDPYPALMTFWRGTNVLSPVATSDGRWYVNIPLPAATQAVVQASYQGGGLTETRSIQWLPVNVLKFTNSLWIRAGDSLLFNAPLTNGGAGSLQIVIGTNTLSGPSGRGVAFQFDQPGAYTVAGTCVSPSGATQSGSVTVNVVRQRLAAVPPAAWTSMQRFLDLTNLDAQTVLQADSRLGCSLAGTNATGGARLALTATANDPQSIVARLGTNGPVLGSIQVRGFDARSGLNTHVVEQYPDGSALVEMLVVCSPVETNVTFLLQPIVGGVIFDDGTTTRTLTAANFDALGQCPVRFIRAPWVITSVCHSMTAFQGPYRIGYLH